VYKGESNTVDSMTMGGDHVTYEYCDFCYREYTGNMKKILSGMGIRAPKMNLEDIASTQEELEQS
jgi:hypothetical protein